MAGKNLYVLTKREGANEVLQVSVEYDELVKRYEHDRASAYEFPKKTRDVTGRFQGSQQQLVSTSYNWCSYTRRTTLCFDRSTVRKTKQWV